MTLGDKLANLRREHHYTQEQLADMLGVSRQAVSKWESDAAYPEIEKLLRLGELYGCSMDYLLKDQGRESSPPPEEGLIRLRTTSFEKRSRRSVCGLPLWHINIGLGRTAKGVVAIGLSARGVVSLGLLSVGLVSFGLLSFGVLALGMLAVGLLAVGSIAVGVIAAGAICFGVLSVGALSFGYFAVGAMAVGKYFALGDSARALIALGGTEAAGEVYQKLGRLTAQEVELVRGLLDAQVPPHLGWAKEIIKEIIKWFL